MTAEAINLMPWMPNFQFLFHKIRTTPIWVCLLGLPIEYWDEEMVVAVARKIGKPLKIDDKTSPMIMEREWIGKPLRN